MESVGEERKLQPTLSLLSSISILVGNIIGSGIFASPGSTLAHTHSAGLSIIAWIASGIVAIMGTACYADLGTSVPKSGGEYTYLFRTYGQLYAYLFSWTSNLIIQPSAIAIQALVCGQYALKPFYLNGNPPNWLANVIATGVIVATIVLNVVSIKATSFVQRWLTYAKLAAIAVVITIGFIYFGKVSSAVRENYDHPFRGSYTSPSQFGVAVIAGLFAYDGWNNLNFVVDEIKDPVRNIPLSLFISVPLVIVCYTLSTASYMAVLPLNQIADFSSGQTVAGFVTTFGNTVMGLGGQIFFSISIALSCFGAANGGLFCASRIVHESATRGDFPHIFTKLYGVTAPTPIASILFEGIVAGILLLSGGFDALLNLYSVAEWIFYFLAVLAVIVLRWKEPNLVRPFKVWLIVPILFCLFAVALVVALFLQGPVNSAIAVGLVIAGIPVFFLKERYGWFKPISMSCIGSKSVELESAPLLTN